MTPPIRMVSVPVALLERMKEQLWEKPVRSDVTLVRKMIEDLLTAAPVREEGGAVAKACADFQEAIDYFEADVADALAEDSERADLWDREVTVNIDALKTVMSAALATREEAPDWTARTEAAWAENNREEAPACKKCGDKGYTEYEGGGGEGYPSRPEIEACSCSEEAPAEAGEPMTEAEVRQWIEACNHEPARQVLRDYLALRAQPEARS